MAERTLEELAESVDDARRDLGSDVMGPYITRLHEDLELAAARLRSMPEGERIEGVWNPGLQQFWPKDQYTLILQHGEGKSDG